MIYLAYALIVLGSLLAFIQLVETHHAVMAFVPVALVLLIKFTVKGRN